MNLGEKPEGIQMSTLFEKLGGEAAVDAAVDKFYRKVLADERVNQRSKGQATDPNLLLR